MYNRINVLEPPQKFDFPFEPYEIQHDFMTNLYRIIEGKNIGIFESPTGTGKSLSLTCGALKWLIDHDKMTKLELTERITKLNSNLIEIDEKDSQDWVNTQHKTIQLTEELASLKLLLNKINENDGKLNEIKNKVKIRRREKKQIYYKDSSQSISAMDINKIEEDECIIDETSDVGNDDEEKMNVKGTQIFYCSRTHSQLSQVVNEIKNTVYGKLIRVVSLASRKNYCINSNVQKLQSNSLINERCLDMQKSKAKITSMDSDQNTLKKSKIGPSKCPFFHSESIEILRDQSLCNIMDIEELTKVGRSEKACPYYAARKAASDAQIILLPYQMLLHEKTRKQAGLDITNSVIIVDEAHNLIDTISNIHSCEISLNQLQLAHKQLSVYKKKYCERFGTKNLLKINQLMFITNQLVKLLNKPVLQMTKNTRMIKPHELVTEGEFFNLKLDELLDFAEQTRLAQKIQGFVQRYPEAFEDVSLKVQEKETYLQFLSKRKRKLDSESKNEERKMPQIESTKNTQFLASVIQPLLSFLNCLLEKSNDGRVLLVQESNNSSNQVFMKYLLLNPKECFDKLLTKCRSLIVAGGTMQPTKDLVNQLFNDYKHRVQEFFYNHVVSKNSILPLAVGKGPENINFSFNFTNRCDKTLMTDLGATLQNVCNIVPAGVVCFFGSYDYMETIYKYLSEIGTLDLIRKRKKIFKESKNANQIEKMLMDYAEAAKSKQSNGALLFAVVGGKLSEGLNFSDDLGRCVIVVGLPFLNKNNPELAEKLRYLDKTYNGSGAEYYENICMKAVNQCIGRAVRHINDYAVVLLLDERYFKKGIRNKLPHWIESNLNCVSSFGILQSTIIEFFSNKS